MHWRNPRRVRRRASGRTVAYNLRFAGQVFDGEAGLHQNMARDYDPAAGRYVESDPLGLKAGINTYAYVGSNSVSFNDPTGLSAGTIQCDGNNDYDRTNKKGPATQNALRRMSGNILRIGNSDLATIPVVTRSEGTALETLMTLPSESLYASQNAAPMVLALHAIERF
jgi:RHS repeat-associated protein